MAIDRRYILDEIRRTAALNGGVPMSKGRFQDETGIRVKEWLGRYWARWGDAVREAGFEPNEKKVAIDEDVLLRCLVDLVVELGRFPSNADRMLRSRKGDFPSNATFVSRLGTRSEMASRMAEYCRANGIEGEVLEICERAVRPKPPQEPTDRDSAGDGYVHLDRLGRNGTTYRIGRSNHPARREYEIGRKLPKSIYPVHTIRTDDPVGIERYWHDRFSDKRASGDCG